MLRVFIGYDSREPDAYEVCADSLRKHSSVPLAITALKQDRLRARGLYTRPEDEPASTEFAHTRFLVPHLCNYAGQALFVDCDFLFTRDILQLGRHVDPGAFVNVVKHDYVPKAKWKMDGHPQVAYPRKNWSSLMVFNNERCRRLTPQFVNDADPQILHRFVWAEEKIGELPQEWNWLEGEYDWPHDDTTPAAIHFTNGGPWHTNHKGVRFGDLWVHALAEIRARQGQ